MTSASMSTDPGNVFDSRAGICIEDRPETPLQWFTSVFLDNIENDKIGGKDKPTSFVSVANLICVAYGSLAVIIPSPSLSQTSSWGRFCLIWSAVKLPSATKLRIVSNLQENEYCISDNGNHSLGITGRMVSRKVNTRLRTCSTK